MYLEYWGMESKPFDNTPDPRFFYHSNQHDAALMKMTYLIEERRGAGVLVGDIGCGKTLIIRSILAGLNPGQFKTAVIVNPQMDTCDMLLTITRQLGGGAQIPLNRSDILMSNVQADLENILVQETIEGREVLVIIEEAHVIDRQDILETMRLLLNYQTEDRFLLTLVLIGQPELLDQVDGFTPLEQRLAMKCYLGPLIDQESKEYILFRLKEAGCQRGIFTKGGAELVVKYAQGIPRNINRICDLALLTGLGLEAKKIGPDIIEMVMRDLTKKLA